MASRRKANTPLQEALEQKRIAEDKLRTFVNIIHEIRTPLTLANSTLLTLLGEDSDPHRRLAYDTMRRNAEHIMRLVNQMIDVMRLEQGRLRMHMCETDLIGYVESVMKLFAHQARSKMIILDFQHDMALLPVWMDRIHFDKVLVNILSNAFRYTPEGGFITLRAERSADHASISVRDTGIGIPEDRLPHVFDRFYQAHLTAEERNIGTGIGLDLAHMLVDLHHGHIEVHNNVEGPGCEFKITLPLGCAHLSPEELLVEKEDVAHYQDPLEEVTRVPVADSRKGSNRQRIVIVEPEADVRDFLVSELREDYDLATCADGREGLAVVAATMPDLVISDVMMAEMDGHALCSRLKGNSATNHIPVILLTNSSTRHIRLELIAADADAYVMRPFDMDILRVTIDNLLRRHQMLRMKYGRKEHLESMVDEVSTQKSDERLLERLMAVINRHMDNAELSVETVAAEVGISRMHLHRKMKQLTGQTPHDFIRSLRLKRAATLLAAGGRSVTEVTYACGFSSAASFSTIFKKAYGISPREYITSKEP